MKVKAVAIIGEVRVKVSTEVLRDKAQNVTNSIKNMGNCFSELESIINRTVYYWIGDAAEQHRRIYREQRESIDEMMKRLKEHPQDLLTISQNYDLAEKQTAEMINRLPGNIIE